MPSLTFSGQTVWAPAGKWVRVRLHCGWGRINWICGGRTTCRGGAANSFNRGRRAIAFSSGEIQGDNTGLKVAFIVMKFLIARVALLRGNFSSTNSCFIPELSPCTDKRTNSKSGLWEWLPNIMTLMYHRRFQCWHLTSLALHTTGDTLSSRKKTLQALLMTESFRTREDWVLEDVGEINVKFR